MVRALGIGIGTNFLGGSSGTTLYFSNTGNNANSGLTPALAKQTITHLNTLSPTAGTTIAFKGGDTFNDAILAPAAGVTYTSYGTGKATLSPSTATSRVINIGNVNNVTINNLAFTGTTNQAAIYAAFTASITALTISNVTISGTYTRGIDINSNASGAVGTVTVSGSTVSSTADNGITIYCSGGTIGTVAISGTTSSSNTYAGFYIGTSGSRSIGTLNISDSVASSNGQNGFTCSGVSTGGTLQRLTAASNGATTAGGVGIFVWNSANVTVQYCESYNNTSPAQDGDGFDLEATDSCIVQYCYSHGNKGAGFFMYNYSGSPGHSNCTFRYNVSINDGSNTAYGGIVLWADNSVAISNARVYNNTVYNNIAGGSALLLTDGPGLTGFIANNIFVASGTANQKGGTGGGSMTVDTNVWFGGVGTGYGTNKITSDPKLYNPGSAPTIGIWNPTSLSNYYLTTGSPALDAGSNIASVYSVSPGTLDFFGNTIAAMPPNIGAYDGAAVAALVSSRVTSAGDTRVTSAGDTRITA